MTTALTPSDGTVSSTPSTEPGPSIAEPALVAIPHHSAASLFPMCSHDDLTKLIEDIRVHGIHEPIVLDRKGRLLDGRNRWLAIQQLGIPCTTRIYIGDDPVGFVVSQNLHRRHVTNKQRAEIAASLATNTHGGDRRSIKSPNGDLKPTQAEAAALMNVSKRSVERAASAIKALEKGDSPKSEQEKTSEKREEPTPRPTSSTSTTKRRMAHKLRGHHAVAAHRTPGAVRALQRAVDRLRYVVPASLCEHAEARRWRHDLGEAATVLIAIARCLRPESPPVPIQPSSRTSVRGS
jgi:hypothetical protein